MTPAARERADLLSLLEKVGPTSDTLCDGWQTQQLAAHLVARERQPAALPGILLPPLHGLTQRIEKHTASRPYEELLATLADGPPLWAPARWTEAGELAEWFVHHEDARRPVDPTPRAADPALDDALWGRLAIFGRVNTLKARGLAITLETPDGRTRTVRKGDQAVTLRGSVTELTLWLFGRRDVAQVEIDGTPEAVSAATQAQIGL